MASTSKNFENGCEVNLSKQHTCNDNTQLQNDKISLQIKNELANENEQLRNLCDSLKADKIKLQAQIDDFQLEKAALVYDKEQWSLEKHILLSSKKDYMDEIYNREQKMNELRIQMIKEKSELQREIAILTEKNNNNSLNATRISKALQDRETELSELKEKMKNIIYENTSKINELEAELCTRERLTKVYKESMEKADLALSEARDNESRLEKLVKEKEEEIKKLQENQEIEKHQILNDLNSARLQLKDSKKVDEDVIEQYEEQRKRALKEMESVLQQLADAEASQKRAENSKMKMQEEMEKDRKLFFKHCEERKKEYDEVTGNYLKIKEELEGKNKVIEKLKKDLEFKINN